MTTNTAAIDTRAAIQSTPDAAGPRFSAVARRVGAIVVDISAIVVEVAAIYLIADLMIQVPGQVALGAGQGADIAAAIALVVAFAYFTVRWAAWGQILGLRAAGFMVARRSDGFPFGLGRVIVRTVGLGTTVIDKRLSSPGRPRGNPRPSGAAGRLGGRVPMR